MLFSQGYDYAGWGMRDNFYYRWSLGASKRQLEVNGLNTLYAVKDSSSPDPSNL